MADYYRILEIDKKATSTEIRAAYKRMAMLYHPDRNAGDKEAEEKFKQVNEAYHVLSDPLKKSRYDHGGISDYETILTSAYYQEIKKRQQFTRWKQAQQTYRYTFDKQYYRIQALAFVVFLAISGLCFLIIHTVEYLAEQERDKHWRQNSQLLKQVNALYSTGEFDKAFRMINELHVKDPMEFRFNFARDSLVGALRRRAEYDFDHKDFKNAAYYYTILKDHERPASLETLNRIASCQYYLGNYGESLKALKHLLNQQPWNLELVYRIGITNLENTGDPVEALHYFTLGKKLFKKNLTEVYGKAFTVVMDPWDVPDIYYAIFVGRAKANIALRDYEEALTDCNWAIFLRRNNAEGYHLRATVRIESKKLDDLCPDLASAQKYGDPEADALLLKYCK